VTHVESGGVSSVPEVGDDLHLRAHVQLDGLAAEDVTVEVVYGKSLGTDELRDVAIQTLEPAPLTEAPASGATLFTGTVELDRAGAFGYTVRVVPKNDLLISPAEMGLVAIAN